MRRAETRSRARTAPSRARPPCPPRSSNSARGRRRRRAEAHRLRRCARSTRASPGTSRAREGGSHRTEGRRGGGSSGTPHPLRGRARARPWSRRHRGASSDVRTRPPRDGRPSSFDRTGRTARYAPSGGGSRRPRCNRRCGRGDRPCRRCLGDRPAGARSRARTSSRPSATSRRRTADRAPSAR